MLEGFLFVPLVCNVFCKQSFVIPVSGGALNYPTNVPTFIVRDGVVPALSNKYSDC